MYYCIRLIFVLLALAASLSSYANPEFWALVKKAAPTPPGSSEWVAVEAALSADPFVDMDWRPEGDISAATLIADHNPDVVERLRRAQKAYDDFWWLVRETTLLPSTESWAVLESGLLDGIQSKFIDCKMKGRPTVRTLLLLYNFPLYERVFGKCSPFPDLWRLLVNTIVAGHEFSWYLAQERMKKDHRVLDWFPENGENLREIVRVFKPEFYQRTLAPLEHYQMLERLGEGYFGVVFKARHRETGGLVAVKQLKEKQYRQAALPYPPREVALMQALKPHGHIVRLLETIQTEDSVFLMTEVAERGEFFDYCTRRAPLSEERSRFFMRQILSAIDFLHRNNVVHRDLKLENILLDAKGNIKIADLGLGAFFGQSALDTFCGSPDYAAPEMWKNQKYDGPSVDVWSMGVLLYIMLTKFVPFPDNGCIVNCRYYWPEKLALSAELKRLVGRIFQFVGQRIRVDQMILDDWMNDNGRLPLIRRQPIAEVFEGEPPLERAAAPAEEPAEELVAAPHPEEDVHFSPPSQVGPNGRACILF